MALELSKKSWVVTSSTNGRRIRRVTLKADLDDLLAEVDWARRRFKLPEAVQVVTCYEAGFSGFWLHRRLSDVGILNFVTKSTTVGRKRRGRSAKTDRLDAEALLKALVRTHRDGDDDLRPIAIPSDEVEDRRRLHRERERLVKEKNQHNSRMGSLLRLLGIEDVKVPKLTVPWLGKLRAPKGKKIPKHTRRELEREIVRRDLVEAQRQELENEQQEILEKCGSRCAEVARRLKKLKGVGPHGSWILSHEVLGWREFPNRRELGASAGLTGTPYQSGGLARDQGISKAGNARVRKLLVELSWMWVRWQPESELTEWFRTGFGKGKRQRRIGIVALARKLLVALWKYERWGEIPKGAVLNG